MKKIYTVLFLFSLALNMTGGECTVKISYTINKSNPPSYNFSSDYTGTGAKYYWYFGDNTTSETATPTHSYKLTDSYSVKLKVLGADNQVCVGNLTARFEGSGTTNTPSTTTYSGKGKVKTSEVTSCGLLILLDNGTLLFPAEVVPNFTLKANQYVELAYELLNGSTICQSGKPVRILKIAEISVANSCKAYFSATNQLWSDPAMIKKFSFANQSTGDIKELVWTFGDGSTSTSTTSPIIHEYKEYGEYKACLTIVTAAGCKSEYCAAIAVKNPAVTGCKALFTAVRASETDAVLAKNFTFKNQSTGEIKEVLLKFGDGSTATNVSTSWTHTYKESGAYNVCMVIKTTTGCSSDFCTTIKVGTAATNSPTTTCGFDILAKPKTEGSSVYLLNAVSKYNLVSWVWTISNGQSFRESQPSVTFQPGVYEIKCVTTTAEGCTSSRSIKLSVGTTTSTICKGAFVLTLIDPSSGLCDGKAMARLVNEANAEYPNVNYKWSTGVAGNSAEGLCADKFYSVQAMVEGVCQKGTNFSFQSKPVWKVTASSDGKYGFSVTDPIMTATYKWDLGDGNTAAGSDISHSYAKEGTYNVKLSIISEGSSADFSKEVTVSKSAQSIETLDENHFSIFPNPASDMLRIDFGTEMKGKLIIEAIDFRGQKILGQQMMGTGHSMLDLDIHDLPSGLFILKVTDEKRVVRSQRFMKQ